MLLFLVGAAAVFLGPGVMAMAGLAPLTTAHGPLGPPQGFAVLKHTLYQPRLE